MSPEAPLVPFGPPAAWMRATGLATGALRRRLWLIAAVALVFTGVAAAAASMMPRTYSADARILVRRNYMMPALAHPRRAVPPGAEVPEKSAAEFVTRRSAMLKIARDAKLPERMAQERPALAKYKDKLLARFRTPLTPEEQDDALMGMLAKNLRVVMQDDILTLRATWTNRDAAYDIVRCAIDAFLEARRQQDVEPAVETAAILERNAEVHRKAMEERLQLLADARKGEVKPLVKQADEGDGLDALRATIFDARRQHRDLAHQRSLKIAELEARLAEQSAVLTDAHPDVRATRDALERMRAESPEIARAREAEEALLAQYAARGGTDEALVADERNKIRKGEAKPEDGIDAVAARSHENDEATAYARSLLRMSTDSYEDLSSRVEDVKLEAEAARAAFPFRYQVTQPPRLPRKPDGPKVPLIILGGLIAGLACGVMASLVLELRRQELFSFPALAQHIAAGTPKAA